MKSEQDYHKEDRNLMNYKGVTTKLNAKEGYVYKAESIYHKLDLKQCK